MAIFDKPPRRRSYILTFWEERSQGQHTLGVWRFRLENLHTGRNRGFASLAEMISFLRAELVNREINNSGE